MEEDNIKKVLYMNIDWLDLGSDKLQISFNNFLLVCNIYQGGVNIRINIWAWNWVWICYSLEFFTHTLKDCAIIWFYIWQSAIIELCHNLKMRVHSRTDFVSTCITFALKWYSRWTLYRSFTLLHYTSVFIIFPWMK